MANGESQHLDRTVQLLIVAVLLVLIILLLFKVVPIAASAALILRLIALVCFALAALGLSVPRLNLVALGLFCWCLSPLA